MISPATFTGTTNKERTSSSSSNIQGTNNSGDTSVDTMKVKSDDVHQRKRPSLTVSDKSSPTKVPKTRLSLDSPDKVDYTGSEKANAALKIQSFVRGCLCRARVNDMLGKLIEQLIREQEECRMQSMNDPEDNIREEGYNDSPDRLKEIGIISDDDTEEEIIDGLHFPSSLPSYLLKEGNNSVTSLGKIDFFEESDHGIHSTSSIKASNPTCGDRTEESSNACSSTREGGLNVESEPTEILQPPSVRDRIGTINRRPSDVILPPQPNHLMTKKSDLSSSDGDTLSRSSITSLSGQEDGMIQPSLKHVETGKRPSVRDIVHRTEDRAKTTPEQANIEKESPSKGSKASSLIRDKMNSFAPPSAPVQTSPSMQEKQSKLSSMPQSIKKKGYWIDKKPIEEPKIPERTQKALDIPPIFGVMESKKKKKKSSTKPVGKCSTKAQESEADDNSTDDAPFSITAWQKLGRKMEAVGTADIAPASSPSSEMVVEETPLISIAARKLQLGISGRSEEGNSSTQTITSSSTHDEEVKRFDFAARRYVMERAATRIQALARGYFYRKKDREATLTVVKWLKQFRRIDLEMEDTAAVSDETRLRAVNALVAEIEATGYPSKMEEDEPTEPILSISERKNAFQQKSEGKAEIQGAEPSTSLSHRASTRLKETRTRQNEAAVIIQSTFRGWKVRRVDYKAMKLALRYLKEYKRALLNDPEADTDLEVVATNGVTSDKARATLVAVREKLDYTATKIQAICRGFIARKFDLHAMVTAITWIKTHQDAFSLAESSYEPDETALETAWIFLEENKTWAKDGNKSQAVANNGTEEIDDTAARQASAECAKVDVADLLNTWEWLLKNESRRTMVGHQPTASSQHEPQEEKIPELDKLATLQDWIEENQVHLHDKRSLTASKARVYNDASVSAGSVGGISTVSSSMRTSYSVASDGTGTTRSSGRRVFTDASVGLEGTKTQQAEGRRFYTDDSISAGGQNDVLKNSPRVHRDSSISTGITSDYTVKDGANQEEERNMKDTLSLWRWLESNQMNMKVFEKPQESDTKNKNLEGKRWGQSQEKETYGTHGVLQHSRGRRDGVECLNDSVSQTIVLSDAPEHKNSAEKVVDNFSSVDDSKPSGDRADSIAMKVEKPSMKSMLTYWQVSSQYEPAKVGLERKFKGENLIDQVPNKPNQTADKRMASLEGTVREAAKDWRESPANNKLLGTLAWLKNQGLKLDDVGKSETMYNDNASQDGDEASNQAFDETISKSTDANGVLTSTSPRVPTKNDMTDTLKWLQANGYRTRSKNWKKGVSDESTAKGECQPKESDSDNIENTRNDEVQDMPTRNDPPSAAEIASSLKWLGQNRVHTSDEDAGNDEETNTAEVGPVPDKLIDREFDRVLFSLSWLKQNGFALDKDSKSVRSLDDEIDNTGCPTLQEVESAVESIDGNSFESTAQSESTNEGTKFVDNDMKRTLDWLSKRGMRLRSNANATNASNESSSVATVDSVPTGETPSNDPEVDRTGSKPTIASFQDQNVSVGEPTLARRKSETTKSQEMSSALQWLQSRGIKLEKKTSVDKSIRSPSLSDAPSVKEAEAVIESLYDTTKSHEMRSIESGNESELGMPSEKEVEQAVSWLKLRESTTRMAEAEVGVFKRAPADKMTSSRRMSPVKTRPIDAGMQVDKERIEAEDDTGLQRNAQTRSGRRDRPPTRSNDKSTNNGASEARPTKTEMEKALSFLQHQVTNRNRNRNSVSTKGKEASAKQKPTPKAKQNAGAASSKRLEPPPVEEKPMTQEQKDYMNAFRWLSNQEIDTPEDIPYFVKLDLMLPMTGKQTKESRAQEIAKALKWVKKQGIVLSGKRQGAKPAANLSKSASVPAVNNKQTTDKDYQNCMKWLTSKNRESVEDANYFNKLDSMLPFIPGQTHEERARDMVRALRWVKKKNARKGALNNLPETSRSDAVTAQSPSVAATATTKYNKEKSSSTHGKGKQNRQAQESVSQKTTTKPRRPSQGGVPERHQEPRRSLPQMMKQQKELKEAVALSRSSGTYTKQKQQPQQEISSPQETMRTSPKIVQEKNLRAGTDSKKSKTTGGSSGPTKPSSKRSMKPSKQDEKSTNLSKRDDKSTKPSKQDEKKGMPPKTTRRESYADSTSASKKENSKVPSPSTPSPDEDFDMNVANALKWLTDEDRRDELDGAAALKKIDAMLPKRAGQTPQRRAVEMARAMTILQKRGSAGKAPPAARAQPLVPTPSSASSLSSPSPPSPPSSPPSSPSPPSSSSPSPSLSPPSKSSGPTEAATDTTTTNSTTTSLSTPPPPEQGTMGQDRVDALAYLRAKATGKDTLSSATTAQFRRLDNMMPSRKDQSDEERAEAMAKMMAWLRKIGKAK